MYLLYIDSIYIYFVAKTEWPHQKRIILFLRGIMLDMAFDRVWDSLLWIIPPMSIEIETWNHKNWMVQPQRQDYCQTRDIQQTWLDCPVERDSYAKPIDFGVFGVALSQPIWKSWQLWPYTTNHFFSWPRFFLFPKKHVKQAPPPWPRNQISLRKISINRTSL